MDIGSRFDAPEFAALRERAARVRLLTCDVDGVLTDGRIYFNDEGIESRAFHASDGLGIKLLLRAGIEVAWITGSHAAAIEHRAKMLGVKHIIRDALDKITPWRMLRQELGFDAQSCAHIGDDLPDLPLLAASGLAVTVPNAPSTLRAAAHYVTETAGGLGAVRELCDLIFVAQNIDFDATMEKSA
ncbi:MAG: HAD hydrolase family protein [Burkholderiales bacterium]|jgi:3-deoxy-D-manno-octulosonate 8-phosphate phosphatase (KDO 8-P phosphatase)|nr:HAD hydrolase family protein [Burkholderiales bacterium]